MSLFEEKIIDAKMSNYFWYDSITLLNLYRMKYRKKKKAVDSPQHTDDFHHFFFYLLIIFHENIDLK